VYPNGLQIFHFCCIHRNKKEKSKPCCHTSFEVKTEIKSLLGNAGNNEENNCKPDHKYSELVDMPLASKKQIVKIFFNI
jgi:hypothetical protein